MRLQDAVSGDRGNSLPETATIGDT